MRQFYKDGSGGLTAHWTVSVSASREAEMNLGFTLIQRQFYKDGSGGLTAHWTVSFYASRDAAMN